MRRQSPLAWFSSAGALGALAGLGIGNFYRDYGTVLPISRLAFIFIWCLFSLLASMLARRGRIRYVIGTGLGLAIGEHLAILNQHVNPLLIEHPRTEAWVVLIAGAAAGWMCMWCHAEMIAGRTESWRIALILGGAMTLMGHAISIQSGWEFVVTFWPALARQTIFIFGSVYLAALAHPRAPTDLRHLPWPVFSSSALFFFLRLLLTYLLLIVAGLAWLFTFLLPMSMVHYGP